MSRNRSASSGSSIGSAVFGRLFQSLGVLDADWQGSDRRSGAGSLVGIDMAPELRESRNRLVIPLIATAILAGLGLVGLRIDLIRMQYETAEAGALEQDLLDQKQALTVEMRRLRDPSRLVVEARRLGFERPQRVIDVSASPLPAVSSGSHVDGSQP